MFRMKRLEVLNWDYWQRMVLPLDASIVTLVGPNGSGKTTMLDALRTILHLNCSDKRDYKQYVRHNGSGFAWLRAVVSNEKQGRRPNSRPFRFLSDEVTLACRIKRSGASSWTREYAMAPGDVTIEEFEEKAKGVEWMKTGQYVSFLEDAGLTSSIRKVLSLEQGDTDKLCKYTPRALLQLVFDAFGDKECLDSYSEAKEKQQEAAREMEQMVSELDILERQVDVLDGKCRNYHEWERLTVESSKIETKVLPIFEIIDRQAQNNNDRLLLDGERSKLVKLGMEMDGLEATLIAHRNEASELGNSLKQHEQLQTDANKEFREIRDKVITAQHKLDDKKRLEDIAKRQSESDVEQLTKELETTERKFSENDRNLYVATQKIEELRGQLACVQSGQSITPPYLKKMEKMLLESGIPYSVFTGIVEISNDKWRIAAEAVLSQFKHIILLDHAKDTGVAKAIGESLRYRHFVVSDRGDVPSVAQGSLRSFVKFKAEPPRWLAKMLNQIQCVASATEGVSKHPNTNWITPSAYYNESRGSRQISGDGHKFGSKHQTMALNEELKQLSAEVKALEEEKTQLVREIGMIKAAMGASDAAQELVSRSLEFADAQDEFDKTTPIAQKLGEDLARLTSVIGEIREKKQQIDITCALEEKGIESVKGKIILVNEKISKLVLQIEDRDDELKQLRSKFVDDEINDDALTLLIEEYTSRDHALAKLEEAKKRLGSEDHWEKDARVLFRRDKMRKDFEATKERLEGQRKTLDSTMQSTDRARESYIGVLRATVSKYASNLESMARIADIEIKVERPKLENNDISLAQAGLGVSFNFDEKGFIALDDGEASGGQQVIKSLILLMALMMGADSSDLRPEKGFIFIDEPYSHLDIFNIDKVGSFLKASGAQFIISTPITHNSNIFDPSYITLSTRKKIPGQKWALPVMHQTRREVESVLSS